MPDVAAVLADPARFVGATLADPLEGSDYGRTKAMIMRRADGSLYPKGTAYYDPETPGYNLHDPQKAAAEAGHLRERALDVAF